MPVAYWGNRYYGSNGIENGGDIALGAFGILFVVWMVTLFPVLGIHQGAQPIIGYNFGAGHYDRVAKTLRLAIYYVMGLTLIFTAILMVFPEVLLRPFVSGENSEAMLALACRATRIACFLLVAGSVTVVVSGYYQAIGNARMAIVLTLIRQIGILVPLLVVMPLFFGLDGMWIALPVTDALALLVTLLLLRRELARLAERQL